MSRVGIYSPTYNVDKYVEEMIQSIRDQSFIDWEIAIIDDGSSDNSFEVATEIAAKDSRITVVKQDTHDGRIGKVKNETIRLFKGEPEFYCSVDSDDIIPPETLKTFVDFMDANQDIGAACGNFICFNDKGDKWAFPHVANTGEFNSDTLLQYMCFFPLRFCRKKFFDMVGGYNNELTSAVDYDLALKLDEVCTIKRIKNPISYWYRQHDIQVSTRSRPEQDTNAVSALNAAIKRRNLDCNVIGDKMPFRLQKKSQGHFIWGKK